MESVVSTHDVKYPVKVVVSVSQLAKVTLEAVDPEMTVELVVSLIPDVVVSAVPILVRELKVKMPCSKIVVPAVIPNTSLTVSTTTDLKKLCADAPCCSKVELARSASISELEDPLAVELV